MTEPRAFVCGHPVSHSRSPLIHGHWLDAYGIRGSYERIERSPADFPAFIGGLADSGFIGGNVTIPHKEAALVACDKVDETAREIGAVNTVWVADGKLLGSNTDAFGFAANLDECAEGWDSARVAVVLGAGGAARAVIHALLERGFEDVRIVNRTAGRAVELSDRFGDRTSAHAWAELPDLFKDAGFVVNTTSLGMDDADAETPDLDPLPAAAIVTDIVYTPLVTPLLRIAKARGLTTVDGLGMLLHQAVPGFERWFSRRPAVTPALRALVERDLEL